MIIILKIAKHIDTFPRKFYFILKYHYGSYPIYDILLMSKIYHIDAFYCYKKKIEI